MTAPVTLDVAVSALRLRVYCSVDASLNPRTILGGWAHGMELGFPVADVAPELGFLIAVAGLDLDAFVPLQRAWMDEWGVDKWLVHGIALKNTRDKLVAEFVASPSATVWHSVGGRGIDLLLAPEIFYQDQLASIEQPLVWVVNHDRIVIADGKRLSSVEEFMSFVEPERHTGLCVPMAHSLTDWSVVDGKYGWFHDEPLRDSLMQTCPQIEGLRYRLVSQQYRRQKQLLNDAGASAHVTPYDPATDRNGQWTSFCTWTQVVVDGEEHCDVLLPVTDQMAFALVEEGTLVWVTNFIPTNDVLERFGDRLRRSRGMSPRRFHATSYPTVAELESIGAVPGKPP